MKPVDQMSRECFSIPVPGCGFSKILLKDRTVCSRPRRSRHRSTREYRAVDPEAIFPSPQFSNVTNPYPSATRIVPVESASIPTLTISRCGAARSGRQYAGDFAASACLTEKTH
jgi:hypothetical protein